MNYKNTAQQIIEACGGENNITQYWHCITRLRFNLVDEKKVDTNKFLSIEGVLGSQFQSGQLKKSNLLFFGCGLWQQIALRKKQKS